MFIERGDTFIGIPFMRAKILFGEIAELSEYKRNADSLLTIRDEAIENARLKESELKQGIAKLQEANMEKGKQYESLERTMKNKKKIWRRRFLVGSGAGLLIGVVGGVLIAK